MNFPGLKSTKGIWVGLSLLALILYSMATIYQISLPGLNHDEALDAVPAMQVALRQPLDNEGVVDIAGQSWPIMVMPYVGAISTYLLIPAFSVFGVSVLTIRFTSLLLGLVTLLLVWGFTREYFDERAAALTVLLLAVNPSFVLWARMGNYVSLPMLPLALTVLWALYRWYLKRGDKYLLVAFFCLGLGLSTKVLFVWYLVALGVAWLCLSPWIAPRMGIRAWLWPFRRTSVRVWASSILLFVLGSAPLLWYNLHGWGTFRLILGNLTRTQLYGVSNLDVLANLRTVVLGDLRTFLNGDWFAASFGRYAANPVAIPAIILAVGVLIVCALLKRLAYSPKRVAFLAILSVSIIIQSSVTVTGFGANHLVIIWPIPQALTAVALLSLAEVLVGKRLIGSRVQTIVVGILILVLTGSEALTTWRHHQNLAQTGGVGHFSDVINDLARDLSRWGDPKPIALDWGLRRNIQILTQGRVNPEERFEYNQHPTEGFVAYLEQQVVVSPTLYLFHDPDYTAFRGHWEVFDQVSYRHRLTPTLVKEYQQADLKPVYRVYRLEPTPRLFDVPQISHPVSVNVGDGLALLGYDISADTLRRSEDVEITLYWQAREQQLRSHKVFVHLLDESGKLYAQHDGVPGDWGYPTTAWAKNEIVPDRIQLSVDSTTPPGDYDIFVGMYDETSGQRLPLQLNNQIIPGSTYQLATVKVQ